MTTRNLSLFHRVRPPLERGEGAPPLLLLLHGYGSHENDLLALASYLDKRFLAVSARAPVVLDQGMYAWFNLQYTERGVTADPAETTASLALLSQFLTELGESYEFDRGRVYLAGFSQGAMMALALALTEPARVAGVVAMSGRLPPELLPHLAAPDALEGLPIFIAHGLLDSMIPVADARATREALSKLPVALTYREYPMAHEVGIQSLTDIAAWLSARLAAE